MQMNIETIYNGLTYPQHLVAARSLALAQQQILHKRKNLSVIKRELQIVIDLCLNTYNRDSAVMKALMRWKQKKIDDNYLYFRATIASEFDSMSNEDYNREGNIYRNLEDRYLSDEELQVSNSSLN